MHRQLVTIRGDVGKSGKIRCGGLPKCLGLSGVQRRRGKLYIYIYILFFFVELFSPEREQNMAFFGATVFFAAVGPCRVMTLEKKKVSTKKTSKISKKSSPRASDTGKGSYKHNAPDLWDRGSITFTPLLLFFSLYGEYIVRYFFPSGWCSFYLVLGRLDFLHQLN